MKMPGAPRVAHRVGRYVASADRRRGQLQHLFNPPAVSLSLGVKLFRQAEPLLSSASPSSDSLSNCPSADSTITDVLIMNAQSSGSSISPCTNPALSPKRSSIVCKDFECREADKRRLSRNSAISESVIELNSTIGRWHLLA